MSTIDTAVSALNSGLSGHLIRPGDADYDKARTVMYGGFDFHPSVIVRVKSASDIQKAVNAARDNSVELAVRSGGHSAAGHSGSEGGIVIDLRDMKAIEIDEATKTVWAQTGVTAEDVADSMLALVESHRFVTGEIVVVDGGFSSVT